MIKIIQLIIFFSMAAVFFTACNNQSSLQAYLVDKRENNQFINIDLPISLFKIDSLALNKNQKNALESLRKINVLALKIDKGGKALYDSEKEKIKQILKSGDYHELVKFGSNQKGASVSYYGEEESVDEVVFFGSDNEKGLILLRVLGDEMNPAHIAQLLSVVQGVDKENQGFESLMSLMK
ncbi:MAG: DUF4252 domain-containing protein [Flavobacteriales bacterium CG_4_9_14_3_um_filter_40_17]|nr:MAG: DUF4252 domain-containing protein [Flavobacteriales bacterium CG_4_9_14_3_um_filter_40_17]